MLQRVVVEQHLNRQLPLGAAFVDETGKAVHLGDYFGTHPAVLTMVYYNCPMLCSEELDGLTSALEMVRLAPGKDFEVVVISIDPSETPDLAARKKALYLKRYGRPQTSAGLAFSSPANAPPSMLSLPQSVSATSASQALTENSLSSPTPAPSNL